MENVLLVFCSTNIPNKKYQHIPQNTDIGIFNPTRTDRILPNSVFNLAVIVACVSYVDTYVCACQFYCKNRNCENTGFPVISVSTLQPTRIRHFYLVSRVLSHRMLMLLFLRWLMTWSVAFRQDWAPPTSVTEASSTTKFTEGLGPSK